MSFIVNQYNKGNNVDSSVFMTPLVGGRAIRIREHADMGIMSAQSISPFLNEGLYMKESFVTETNYYFHAKIKRMEESVQTFYIYLVNKDDASLEASEQYLKTITVQSGTGWADIDFIFSPLMAFDTILFKLQREAIDYSTSSCRYPTIIYQELSIINNLITTLGLKSLYKIGVQSRPGFLMCINGEEIRTGRSGIYELKNGFILITFFSAVAPAEITKEVENLMNSLPQGNKDEITSQCAFAVNIKRPIDNFSLDYVYEGGTV